MILFVSGRCDIPAFYSEWFFHRLEAGFVDVRNPYNEHQISRIRLSDDVVDCILFCTKDPRPMLPRLKEIPFPYLFHVTQRQEGDPAGGPSALRDDRERARHPSL